MMNKSIDVKWDLLGAELALLSDNEQSKFFIGFAEGLREYPTSYSRQMQMHMVADKLSSSQKDLLEELSCLWFKNDN